MNKWCLNRNKHNPDFCEKIIQKYNSFGIYGFAGISLIFFQGKKTGFPVPNGNPDISLQVFYNTFFYHQSFRKTAGDRQRQIVLQKQLIERTHRETKYQSRCSLSAQGSTRKMLYLRRSVRREEEFLQIIRELYERKLSQQEDRVIQNKDGLRNDQKVQHVIQEKGDSLDKLRNRLKRELLFLAEEHYWSEKKTGKRGGKRTEEHAGEYAGNNTERQIQELLYQLERRLLPEEFYLTEEERREASLQLSRLIHTQEAKYQSLGLESEHWEAGSFDRKYQLRNSRNLGGSILKMLYPKRKGKNILYQPESPNLLLRIWKESGPKTELRMLKDRLSEYTAAQKVENRKIADAQMELRKEQIHFKSREDQIVQKERTAEKVLLKKETVLVQKSVEEQENRIHVLQEELQRQKKEMEDLEGKISGQPSLSAVNPEHLTERVLREMQKQFRLEKIRRGM